MTNPPEVDSHHTDSVAGEGGIYGPAFQGLLWTQALTAVNDNVFRWFVIGIGKAQFLPESYPMLLAVGSAFFLIPYLLFASVAGWLGDRFKKSHVILGCKIAEIAIMLLGVLSLSLLGEPNPAAGPSMGFYVMLGAVFLMGTQSALFAPSKMGTIPELLTEKEISAGNGIFALTTLSATIVGTGIGGWLADVTVKAWNAGTNMIMTPLFVMVGIAVVGTALAMLVRSFPAANKSAKFPITLVTETIRDIISLSQMGALFRVALGIVFFWAIAGWVQLNIDVFAEQSGLLVESHRTPLLVATTLGIGIGSAFAGYISAGRIRLEMVPWGALGMAICFFLLYLAPADFIQEKLLNSRMILVCLMLAALGFSAGAFDVPLAAYIQHNSPIEKRGAILAATNCMAFGTMLVLFGIGTLLQSSVREGSVSYLPTEMQVTSLNETDLAETTKLVKQYDQKWTLENSKSLLREIVDSAPAPIRAPLITSLVNLDWEKSKADDHAVKLADYEVEFPDGDDQRMIKKVLRQTGMLPLLTGRQIFLFMALLTIPVFIYAYRNHPWITKAGQEFAHESVG
jgi:acyl-[acyl-carrier-protein]-phospholipid O-acyltransferase/long-chain-fatty-acid--[acyl-carrier-protein] ligase